MDRNNVAAVVVTYNRKELLHKCIEKILGQKGASCDVFVIDNASTDGTQKMMQEFFSDSGIHYYNTGANLGCSGGFQFGVKWAMQGAYKYIWMMDDDTWPSENALDELLKAGEKLDGKWGVLSSVAYWTDGSICCMNVQKKTIFKHITSDVYEKELFPVVMCSFVSLLVPGEVIKEIGLPVGEYFIWTDDYEYTGRISSKYPCYVVPPSKVVHAMRIHTRVNFATDSPSRIGRYRYIYRNDVHCYRRYGLKGWIYIILKDIYTIFNVLLHSKEKKIEKIKILIKGFVEGLSFHPQIEMIDFQ